VRKILTAAALTIGLAVPMTAQQSQVYKVGEDGVKVPVLIKEVKPQYTKGAMDRRVEGNVELVAIVLKDGTVGEDVRVTKSLDAELDQAAIDAAKQWRFRPGTKDDTPVDVQVNFEMSFKLK